MCKKKFLLIAICFFAWNDLWAKPVILTCGLKTDAHSLDLYSLYEGQTFNIILNIYDPLVRRDKNLNLIPGLALKWENPTPTKWIFTLRKNIKFHEGEDFTAEDVVFSYERGISAYSDLKSMLASIKKVSVIDKYIVAFETFAPNPLLPDELYSLPIMSKEWCEKHACITPANITTGQENYANLHANGTGPFKLVKRSPEEETILYRYIGWWGHFEGNIDQVILKPVSSDPTRLSAILSGKLDVIIPANIQDIPLIQNRKNLEIMQKPSLNTLYLGLNVKSSSLKTSNIQNKNPFQNINVRKAIAHAIDINAIKDKIMRNTSRPAGLLIGPGVQGYKESEDVTDEFSIEKACHLLKEAGYEKGFNVTLDCPNNRYINDEKICQAISAFLAKININVVINSMPKSKYFAKVLNNETDFYLMGWQPATYDVHDVYFNIMATNDQSMQGKYNIAGYKNTTMDQLINEIHFLMDKNKRAEKIKEIFYLQKQDKVYLPLHQEPLIWAKKSHIHLYQRMDNMLFFPWVNIQH